MLADFFSRSAQAAAQVLDGFDLERFRAHLQATPVGISTGALDGEADALADMAVRLLARLYPKLTIRAAVQGDRERLIKLACTINPNLEIVADAALGVVIAHGQPFAESIFAGSDGWYAFVGTEAPLATGASENPVGAGAAACLAAARLFRRIFLPEGADRLDRALRLDTYTGEAVVGAAAAESDGRSLPLARTLNGDAVLIGAGAIGNGALWALARTPIDGIVHVVDHETIELSNLQRYVLAGNDDEGEMKVDVVTRQSARLHLRGHHSYLADFVSQHGYRWTCMLLALDSARDRVAAQASLPGWIANAWTQPGDLGVSTHSAFGSDGACVSCLYMPRARTKNEDELVAETLAVPHLLMQVRTLLHTGGPVDRPLLEAIAQGIGRPVDALLGFEGRPVRDLYVEGFCGGAVIPLGRAGRPAADARDVHVPLAHQSALAGILLTGALLRHGSAGPPDTTKITRLNVLDAVGEYLTQPARAVRDGRCICDDDDFRAVYRGKYAPSADGAGD